MIKNIHFTFHPERCVGCGACVMACINENGIDIDQQMPYRLLKSNEYGDDETLNITWFVHGCMHCADSPCARACPKKCFHREPDFGTVQLDNSACVGCKRCGKACPFGAIQYTKDRKAAKCHGCLERLREGQLPLCVQACPRRALTVDEKNRVVAEGCEALKKELNQ
ncbi:MAG: 4Fe-4S dicluster domain-containing protein [Lachnospiraceae bacterium]